ncbi:MAG: hypothetical protein GX558_02450 [Clostridiales bacterium]|nr:hypothetical protein [Clostridiales bacterium]
MQWDIGVQFGESTVRMAARGRGVVMNLPSVAAVRGGEVLAAGAEAQAMLGRAPAGVRFSRPVKGGRLADESLARLWLEGALKQYAPRLKRPAVLALVPGDMPQSDRAALRALMLACDVGRCGLMDTAAAAALGAGLPILRPEASMVVRVGAGRAEARLFSLGAAIGRAELPFGASSIDEGIRALLRERLALSVGPRTAEELKEQLASALPGGAPSADAAGLSGITGFPTVVPVPAELVREAVMPLVGAVADMAYRALESATGQAAMDLIDGGMALTGGGALIFGLADHLTARTGVPCRVAHDPAGCAALGLSEALENEDYARLIEVA